MKVLDLLWPKNDGTDSISFLLKNLHGTEEEFSDEKNLVVLSDMLTVMILCVEENLRYNTKTRITAANDADVETKHHGKDKESQNKNKSNEPVEVQVPVQPILLCGAA